MRQSPLGAHGTQAPDGPSLLLNGLGPGKDLKGSSLSRRRGIRPEPLLALLTAPSPPQGDGPAAFLAALHQLETAANESLQPRRRPR